MVGKTEKNKKMLKKFNLGNLETKNLRFLIWEEKRIKPLEQIVREGEVNFVFN